MPFKYGVQCFIKGSTTPATLQVKFLGISKLHIQTHASAHAHKQYTRSLEYSLMVPFAIELCAVASNPLHKLRIKWNTHAHTSINVISWYKCVCVYINSVCMCAAEILHSPHSHHTTTTLERSQHSQQWHFMQHLPSLRSKYKFSTRRHVSHALVHTLVCVFNLFSFVYALHLWT